MATILQFNPGLRAARSAFQKPLPHGGAEILLFTGIRYERIAETVKADHAKVKSTTKKRASKSRAASGGGRSSAAALRKRDRLELAD
jgi:hypothetical protein